MEGYVQYTLLSILFFNVTYLISIGVYPNPKLTAEEAYNHPKYISTARLEWEEVQSEHQLKITKEDSALLFNVM